MALSRLKLAACLIAASLGLTGCSVPWLHPAKPPPLDIDTTLFGPERLPLTWAMAQGPVCVGRHSCVTIHVRSGKVMQSHDDVWATDGLTALHHLAPGDRVIAILAIRPALDLVGRRGYPAGEHFLWHDLTDLSVAASPGLPSLLIRALLAAHSVSARVKDRLSPVQAITAGVSPYALVTMPQAQSLVSRGEARIALAFAREAPPLPIAVVTVSAQLLDGRPRLVRAVLTRLESAVRHFRDHPSSALERRLANSGVWPSQFQPTLSPWVRLAVLGHLAGQSMPPPELVPLLPLSRRRAMT